MHRIMRFAESAQCGRSCYTPSLARTCADSGGSRSYFCGMTCLYGTQRIEKLSDLHFPTQQGFVLSSCQLHDSVHRIIALSAPVLP